MATAIDKILNVQELRDLPESIKEKINEQFKIDFEATQNYKSENSQLKANIERFQFELEKHGEEAQSQLQEAQSTTEHLRGQALQLENALSQSQQQLIEVQGTLATAKEELEGLRASGTKAALEKQELADQLCKRRKEVMELTEEVRRLTAALHSEEQKVFEIRAKSQDLDIKELEFQHKLKALESERAMLATQLSDHQSELLARTQEIHKLRKEKSQAWSDVEVKLEGLREEKEEAQQQALNARHTAEELSSKMAAMATQLKESRDQLTSAEEQFNLELASQSKLVNLYKESSEENGNKVRELLQTVEEMHSMLRQSRAEYTQLEEKSQQDLAQLQSQLEDSAAEVDKLRTELSHANTLLEKGEEGLKQMFPEAAATSQLLAGSGLSLTQLYSQYLQSQEELRAAKFETSRLSNQLAQIVAEVEEKTPLINQHYAEHQKTMETVSSLQNQLSRALEEREKLFLDLDEALRTRNHLEREEIRLRQIVQDLTTQVRFLLEQVEELRGGVAPFSSALVPDDGSSPGNTIISNHLVTFRNMDELVQTNQKLLGLVRDLTIFQEELEKQLGEAKSTNVEELKAQLAQVEDERNKQAQVVESLVQQRDLYRHMASEKSAVKLKSPTRLPVELSTTQEQLGKLQQEYDVYRRENGENTRLLREQLDLLRKDCSDMRTQNARLISQVEYGEERFKQLHRTLESSKKEVALLQEKNSKLHTTVTVHQEMVKTLRSEVLDSQEKMSMLEVSVESLRSQNERLKSSEQRLQHELEIMQRDQVQYSKISAHMLAVQANLERLESQAVQHTAEQRDKAEQEVVLLRNKLAAEEEKLRSALQLWEGRVKEVQEKLDAEVKSGRQTHDELVEAYSQVHDLKLQLTELKAKASTPPSPCQKESPPLGIQHQIRGLRTQLAEVESGKKALEDQMEALHKSNHHYQQLAEEMEGRLKEQTKLCQDLREKYDKNLQDAQNAIQSLEKEKEELETEASKWRESSTSLHESQGEKVKELEQRMEELSSQLVELDALRQAASQAREDAREKSVQLQEAQDKYERELVLHAQAIEQVTEVKKKFEELERAVQKGQSQARQAQQALKDRMESWSQREAVLKEEAAAGMQRCTDLEQQNSHLHQQLELMSSQMAAMHAKDWSKLEAGSASQHLQEVVHFLRREKDIAEARSDTLQKENTRLQSKAALLEQRMEDLAKELEEEKNQAQSAALANVKHAELLRKVEMLNLLSDSNRLLRAEAEETAAKLAELADTLSRTQGQLEPLKKENADLRARNDALAMDQVTLKAEINRWQARVTSLIEQSPTAEDIRNLTHEKEELQAKLAALQTESMKKQSELSASLVAYRQEMETERASFEATKKKLVEEKESALQASKDQAIETEKKLTQIKKIARKYKAQYDALKDEQGQTLVGHESTVTNLEEELASLRSLLQDSEVAKQTQTEEMDKLKQELSQLEEASKAAVEKEKDKFRRLMQKKLTDLTTQNEELKNRLTEMEATTEEKKALVNTLKSQYEGKLSKLDKEYKTARDAADKLEKQLEEMKRQVAQPSTAMESRVSEPLTANIKPTTVAATLRYANPPTPRTTPTASIRPLAIASSPSTSRMATVPPTPSELPPSEVSSTPIPVISLYSGDVSGSEGTPSSSTEVAVVSTVSAASGDHSESPSSTSVIVVPLPQTQVVMPTVKRPREELPSTSEQDSNKRMRVAAELQPAAIIQQQQPTPQPPDDSTVESSKKPSGGESSSQPPPKSSDSLEEEAMSDDEDEEEEDEEEEKDTEENNAAEEDNNEVEPLSPQALEDNKPQESMEVEAGQEEEEEEEEEENQGAAVAVAVAPRVPPRQNLAPFHIPSAPPSSFEEGDDSIVPSTPTLFVPRRGDGFAEAVSSPQVSRFMLFNPEAPSQSGLSQLASQGGVDDTRMDLSQYDGRSVPTTPVQVSPQTEVQETMQAADSPLMEECTGQEDPVPSLSEAESLEDPQRTTSQEDSQPEPSEGSTLTEVTSSAPEGSTSEAKAEDSQDESSSKPAPPRKPIVWKEPDTSSGPSTSFGAGRGRTGPRIRKIQVRGSAFGRGVPRGGHWPRLPRTH